MTQRIETELETLIRARYPLVYVVSWEERRVEDTLRNIARERSKKLHIWTVTTGFATATGQRDNTTIDPLAALDYVLNAPDQSIFLLKDLHPFIADNRVTRRLRDLTLALKNSFKNLIILSPILKLPSELEKEVTVLDYDLPTFEDLGRLLDDIIRSVRDTPGVDTDLTPEEREMVLKAAQGLTAMEAENVFAKSLVEKRTFDIDVILSEKQQIIRKSGILEYYPSNEAFRDVGGLDILKDWLGKRTASFADKARDFGLPEPKGILLLGVQGCGKSLTAKAIGAQWRLPLLRLDIGKVFQGLVGASEENMRKALRVAESVAPCVASDTRITLADGSERTIQELYEGQETTLSVLSMTEEWQIAPSVVQAITRRHAPDLFTVRLTRGSLQATSNHLHPVLRDGEVVWVRTDALQTGDHIAVPVCIPTQAQAFLRDFLPHDTRLYAEGALEYARLEVQNKERRYAAQKRDADYVKIEELAEPSRCPAFSTITRFMQGNGGTADSILEGMPEEINDEIGYLLGLIASDGYLGKNGRIGFVNTVPSLHERFADILCRNFSLQATMRVTESVDENHPLRGTTPESVFQPCFVSYVDNRLLNRLLRNIEVALLRMPASVLTAWIRGYFDGDGFISDTDTANPKIVLTAKRPVENRRVRAVLQRIGFPTTNPSHANIEITGEEGVRKFIQTVGSEHPCRRTRMNEWLQKTSSNQPKDRTDPIPVGARLRQARQEIGMASHRFASASSSLLHRYENGLGHPNRARLKRVLEEMQEWAGRQGVTETPVLDSLRRLADSPVMWSRVVSVTEEITPEFVYDLVCDAPHNFLANGIFTHNCILWLDELEKGLSGSQSSGSTDGGTTARVFSTFLTWMQEKQSAVFVVSTANQVEALPPELLRKGRFDEIFFIDLPSKAERADIFKIHLRKKKRDVEQFDTVALAEATPGFSGAEIEQAVVEALYDAFDLRDEDPTRDVTTDDLLKAVRATVPLSMTMREKIAYLREWADTRARKASSAPVESVEEQEMVFLMERAKAAESERLEKARRQAQEKEKADAQASTDAQANAAKTNGATKPRTTRSRRVASKETPKPEGEAAS